MGLYNPLDNALASLDAQGLRRTRRIVSRLAGSEQSSAEEAEESSRGTRVEVDGRTLLAFCSNDYLGLANHPIIAQALANGALREGAGSGASALISGHRSIHARLEARLAERLDPWIPNADALYFGAGYLANIGLVDALAGITQPGTAPDVAIFSEALNHASLVDGTRLARAHHGATVHVYPHCNTAALAQLLANSSAITKIILTDSVFSMDGHLAPLKDLLTLAEQYDAWLVVDDAHGFGVLGSIGAGALEHCGLSSANIVYMGTLGKAAGVAGAFIAADCRLIDWLVNRARPYVYSTACPPALSYALLASLDLLGSTEGDQRRAHLRLLCERLQRGLRAGLRLTHWQVPQSHSAIHPLIVGENAVALAAAALLRDQGIWVPAIRPPTVPPGTARLRISLSAEHSAAEVDQLVHGLIDAERQLT